MRQHSPDALENSSPLPALGRILGSIAALLMAAMLVSCGGGGDGGGSTPGSGGNGGGGGATPGGSSMAGQRFEESDATVSLSGAWTPADSRSGWSGGAARQSNVPGATATFTFTGNAVTWIGNRDLAGGIALVRLDGGSATEVDLFARSEEIRTPVITLSGLGAGRHTLTIEVTNRHHPDAVSNAVVVDAFDVESPVVSHLQETDPAVNFSAGWSQADDNLPWSGGGVYTVPDPPLGGARVSDTPGAKVTLAFRGTAISWSGYRGPDAGIALVQVDGGVASEVDTYAPTSRIQDAVFSAKGLADTNHTLTIEVSGRKNAASAGARIFVDAFDVSTPGRRFQEEDAAIAYSGPWNHDNRNRTWSEGSAATTSTAGATVTFAFTGTSVSWIGCRKASTGLAKVYIDGAFIRQIDTYEVPPIEGYQHTIFRADGLASGAHTLTIEAVVTGSIVVVDAFDVHP